MKKSNESKELNNNINLQLNKAKEELTVNIIQYNHKIEKLLQDMSAMIQECINIDSAFNGQRELSSRNKMNIRVINSAIKMMDNNKLRLWMINEKELEDKVKNDNK